MAKIFFNLYSKEKILMHAEFRAHAQTCCDVLNISRPFLSPRVLLHRLVSASRVPSRFRYGGRRCTYVCSGCIHMYIFAYDLTNCRRYADLTKRNIEKRDRERESVWLARGKLALTSRCCRCHEASIFYVCHRRCCLSHRLCHLEKRIDSCRTDFLRSPLALQKIPGSYFQKDLITFVDHTLTVRLILHAFQA